MELSDLKPASYNPRRISPESAKALGRSLGEFGDISGLVWNRATGNLVCGHQRLDALRKAHDGVLRMDGEAVVTPAGERFPVRVVEWPVEKEKLANVAANSPFLAGEFDDAELTKVLAELEAALPAEFGELRLEELWPRSFAKPGLTDPDALPDVSAEPITKPGDLWLLGEHRIICGDSTKADDVARLTCGDRIFSTVTDPPYSVAYERSRRERGGSDLAHAPYHDPDVNAVMGFMRLLPSDVLVMTYPLDRHFFILADALRTAGFELRKECVWVKDRFSFWPGAQYQQRHEPILICARAGQPVNSDVPPNESTVFDVPAPRAHDLHATAKPIELWSRLVGYHVAAGESVYDPFLGSGTTIIAAEQLGRRAFGIEIEPRYVDVCVRRWEAFTGKKADRQPGG